MYAGYYRPRDYNPGLCTFGGYLLRDISIRLSRDHQLFRAGRPVAASFRDPAGSVFRFPNDPVVNLARSTPAAGWANCETPSFLDRARGHFDAVLMLALIHHLLVTERIPLDSILELAADLVSHSMKGSRSSSTSRRKNDVPEAGPGPRRTLPPLDARALAGYTCCADGNFARGTIFGGDVCRRVAEYGYP
jgi:hypothetical protein